jgi:uncharacterized membrane protein
MNFYLQLFELGALLTFLLLLFAERKNRITFEVLILAFLYGLILEALNIYMSGAYLYSQGFLLDFGNVPLAIGAGWAIVYYLANEISQKFNLKWWQSPSFMALIALSYDLAIDVIAIRLGFWSWHISFNEEWFGVPYENFFGWMVVIWVFAMFMNFSSQNFIDAKMAKVIRRCSLILAPAVSSFAIISFINLSAIFSKSFSVQQVMDLFSERNYLYAYAPEVQAMKGLVLLFLIIASSVSCFVWMRRKGLTEKTIRINYQTIALSFFIHSLFLFLLVISGIYKDFPIFILFAIILILLNLYLEFAPSFYYQRFAVQKEVATSEP